MNDNVAPALNPRRWHALPVVLTGSFLSFLDFFIVNIALPAIRHDLTASPAQLQLIVAAYGIGFGVSLITGGRIGDMYGRKRVFLIGVGAFTIASALCGLALTPGMLVASRTLQGLTAALMTPQVLAIIRVEFSREEQPFAIGLYGASMGFASIVAQLVGGPLVGLDIFGWSWRSVFLINIPIGLIAIVVGMRTIKESRSLRTSPLDFLGIGFASLVLFFLIYPIVQGRESGWPLWSFVMVALVPPLMTAFIAHERIDRFTPFRKWHRFAWSDGFISVLQRRRGILCNSDGFLSGRLWSFAGRNGSDVSAICTWFCSGLIEFGGGSSQNWNVGDKSRHRAYDGRSVGNNRIRADRGRVCGERAAPARHHRHAFPGLRRGTRFRATGTNQSRSRE